MHQRAAPRTSAILVLALALSALAPGADTALPAGGPGCLHDTHVECGELVTWNDTASPASTILELSFPVGFDARSGAVRLSTCHKGTTASTTLKLFDACPLTADSGAADPAAAGKTGGGLLPAATQRSAVAANSRDRACRDADRAATLTFAPTSAFPQTAASSAGGGSGDGSGGSGYFSVVTAGARSGPESGEEYGVTLLLSCFDTTGREVRGGTAGGTAVGGDAANGGSGLGGSSSDGGSGEQGSEPKAAVRRSQSGRGDALRFSRRLGSGNATVLPSGSPSPSPLPSAAPTQLPLPLPSPAPSSPSPSSLPSSAPSTLPSLAPSLVPLSAPTLSPSLSPRPTVSFEPSPSPSVDLCRAINATCGVIVAGDTTRQLDFEGAVAGEVSFLLAAPSPRHLRAAVCPSGSGPPSTRFKPAARLYTACPFEGGQLTGSSATVDPVDVAALAAALGLRNASALRHCAVVAAEVSAGAEGTYHLTVDGAADGEEGAFELTVACELIFYPSPAPFLAMLSPSPQPSVTHAPAAAPASYPTSTNTPAPTQVHARSNCACFSEKMVESIARYCPRLSHRFSEGCMVNVTRAVLKEFSVNCTVGP